MTLPFPSKAHVLLRSRRTAGLIPALLLAALCTLTVIHSRPSDGSGGKPVAIDRVQFLPGQNSTILIGTPAPIVAANMRNDTLVAGVGTYMLATPAGLLVFEDPAMTRPVAAGSPLSTTADGRDTLWATGTATAVSDRTYVLSIPGTTTIVTITVLLPPMGLSNAKNALKGSGPIDGKAGKSHDVLGRQGASLTKESPLIRMISSRE